MHEHNSEAHSDVSDASTVPTARISTALARSEDGMRCRRTSARPREGMRCQRHAMEASVLNEKNVRTVGGSRLSRVISVVHRLMIVGK